MATRDILALGGADDRTRSTHAGLVVIHMVAALPVVAPLVGTRPALGTNPIAFGFPTDGYGNRPAVPARSRHAAPSRCRARDHDRQEPRRYAFRESAATRHAHVLCARGSRSIGRSTIRSDASPKETSITAVEGNAPSNP